MLTPNEAIREAFIVNAAALLTDGTLDESELPGIVHLIVRTTMPETPIEKRPTARSAMVRRILTRHKRMTSTKD